jgi:hypothetical protein
MLMREDALSAVSDSWDVSVVSWLMAAMQPAGARPAANMFLWNSLGIEESRLSKAKMLY